ARGEVDVSGVEAARVGGDHPRGDAQELSSDTTSRTSETSSNLAIASSAAVVSPVKFSVNFVRTSSAVSSHGRPAPPNGTSWTCVYSRPDVVRTVTSLGNAIT